MEEKRRLTLEEIDERHPELIPGAARASPRRLAARPLGRARRASCSAATGARYLDDGRVEGDDPLAPVLADRRAASAPHRRLRPRRRHHGRQLLRPELDEGCAFEELISFHGGLGGPQTRPFILSRRALAAARRADPRRRRGARRCCRAGGRAAAPARRAARRRGRAVTASDRDDRRACGRPRSPASSRCSPTPTSARAISRNDRWVGRKRRMRSSAAVMRGRRALAAAATPRAARARRSASRRARPPPARGAAGGRLRTSCSRARRTSLSRSAARARRIAHLRLVPRREVGERRPQPRGLLQVRPAPPRSRPPVRAGDRGGREHERARGRVRQPVAVDLRARARDELGRLVPVLRSMASAGAARGTARGVRSGDGRVPRARLQPARRRVAIAQEAAAPRRDEAGERRPRRRRAAAPPPTRASSRIRGGPSVPSAARGTPPAARRRRAGRPAAARPPRPGPVRPPGAPWPRASRCRPTPARARLARRPAFAEPARASARPRRCGRRRPRAPRGPDQVARPRESPPASAWRTARSTSPARRVPRACPAVQAAARAGLARASSARKRAHEQRWQRCRPPRRSSGTSRPFAASAREHGGGAGPAPAARRRRGRSASPRRRSGGKARSAGRGDAGPRRASSRRRAVGARSRREAGPRRALQRQRQRAGQPSVADAARPARPPTAGGRRAPERAPPRRGHREPRGAELDEPMLGAQPRDRQRRLGARGDREPASGGRSSAIRRSASRAGAALQRLGVVERRARTARPPGIAPAARRARSPSRTGSASSRSSTLTQANGRAVRGPHWHSSVVFP